MERRELCCSWCLLRVNFVLMLGIAGPTANMNERTVVYANCLLLLVLLKALLFPPD